MPKETGENEARVALTPAGVASLLKAGFGKVVVEKSAGAAANFTVSSEGQSAYAVLSRLISTAWLRNALRRNYGSLLLVVLCQICAGTHKHNITG